MSKVAYIINEEGENSLDSGEDFEKAILVDTTAYIEELGSPSNDNALSLCGDDDDDECGDYEEEHNLQSIENDLDKLRFVKDENGQIHIFNSEDRALRQQRRSQTRSFPITNITLPKTKKRTESKGRRNLAQEAKDLVMIAAVKERPSLWHPRHFVDVVQRDLLFGEVAELCGMSLVMTKKRWKVKREQFIKAHRRKLSQESKHLCQTKLRIRGTFVNGKNYPPVSADILNEAVKCIIDKKLSYREASRKFGIKTTSLYAKVQQVKRRAMNVEEPKAEWKWYKHMVFMEEVACHRYIEQGDDGVSHHPFLSSSEEEPTQNNHCSPIEFLDNAQELLEHQEDSSTMEGESSLQETSRSKRRKFSKISKKPEVLNASILENRKRSPNKPTARNHSTPAKISKSHVSTDFTSIFDDSSTSANKDKSFITRQMEAEDLSDDPLAVSDLTDSDLIGRLVTCRLKELPKSTRQRLICKITNLLYTNCDND